MGFFKRPTDWHSAAWPVVPDEELVSFRNLEEHAFKDSHPKVKSAASAVWAKCTKHLFLITLWLQLSPCDLGIC
jgi:hypothetical protein